MPDIVIRITESGDIRKTESGDIRILEGADTPLVTRCGSWSIPRREYELHNATRNYDIQTRGRYQWPTPEC